MLSARTFQVSATSRNVQPFRCSVRAPTISFKPPTSKVLVKVASEVTVPTLKDISLDPVVKNGELAQFPASPGVYAVYNKAGEIQYVGVSRKVSQSIANHVQELPDLAHAIKVLTIQHATKDSLIDAWQTWIEEAVETNGDIPPGNKPGETKWQSKQAKPPKPEIRLTAGKEISCKVEELLDQVVKTNKVVAFVKGTRTEPMCGFSAKMMNILKSTQTDYEVVNVLDEVYNPGLRDAIKAYSQWPTIPQLYIRGEFVGGADIVEEMSNSGELTKLLS